MPVRILRVVAPLAAVALAACDTTGIFINRSESPSAYGGANYAWSTAAMGSNQVVVYNSPYTPDATINGILGAAHARYQSDQYRFFAGSPIEDWNGYTVVLAFSDGPVGNRNLCST